MPTFVYTGPGSSLAIKGRALRRGIPTELEGATADAAAAHPLVEAYKPPTQSQTPTDPWGSSVKDALAYVGDDAAKAAAVLTAEQAKGDKARKSLIESLEPIATGAGDKDDGDEEDGAE